MTHTHVAKIIAWKLDENVNHVPAKYGCTGCDMEFFEPPRATAPAVEHTHTEFVDGCFACKVVTLHLDPGDASHKKAMSRKKWDGELNAYAEARAQGIQPAGTRMGQIREAEKASETLGRAYSAETMPPAKNITKAHGEAFKEVGI